MYVHSCCCILFCIALFEIRFQIDLNLHFDCFGKKLEKENEFPFLPFPTFVLLAYFSMPMARLSPCLGLRSRSLLFPASAQQQR